jgi:transposase-like protein
MRRQPRQRETGTSPAALAALVRSRYWRAADAARVVALWQRSGGSAAAFARAHGLSVRRLLRWRERLEASTAPVFHPVRVVERREPAGDGAAALELEVRGGRRIRVRAGFDPVLLEELVRTVECFRC